MERERVLRRRIKVLLIFAIGNLFFGGVTVFPAQAEMVWATRLLGVAAEDSPSDHTRLIQFVTKVRDGLQAVDRDYPFIFYGFDWLAFAHIVLAILYIGPLRDPVRNIWVITFGLIASILVFPLALICGPLRGIPLPWLMIDCCFGVGESSSSATCAKRLASWNGSAHRRINTDDHGKND